MTRSVIKNCFTYLESRGRERYLEVHGDRRSRPLFLAVGLQEFNLRRDLRLFHARHPLDPVSYRCAAGVLENPGLCHCLFFWASLSYTMAGKLSNFDLRLSAVQN